MKLSLCWRVLPFALTTAFSSLFAGPVEEIASYGAFKDIDLNSLAGGTILTQRGSYAGFHRGLALQSCYIVNKPLAAAADYIVWWDPTVHPDLDVYVSTDFRRGEDPKFSTIKIDGRTKPVMLLLNDVAKARTGKSELQLSQDELKDLRARFALLPEGTLTDSPEFRKTASDFFSNLLKTRFDLFQAGGLDALPEYEYNGGKLSIKKDIQSLLKEDARVSSHFKDLLNDVFQFDKTPGATNAAPSFYYWQFFKADTEAAFCLGAIYERTAPDRVQIIDSQLYVSNAYFTSVTLYELYPVNVNGKDLTLIWRADYISAPMFEWLHGVDQMAATMLMMQGIKQSVRIFQADAMK